MKNIKGFTLIELLICMVFVIVLVFVVRGALSGGSTISASWGLNGRIETRCINGFVHSVGQRGYTQQTLDEKGHGIKCST